MTHRTLRPAATRLALALAAALPLAAQATNGMLLEGYGPIATGMGGAASAHDNGNAAAMNNPATLALMPAGHRADIALGQLGPRVSSAAGPMVARSGGDSYVMPAFGWTRSNGQLAWGVAVFAQGGMGTEYAADSFLAAGSGAPVRSELGVGRVILPLAWRVNEQFTVGGSLDHVWSSLDLRMAAPVGQLAGLVTGASGNLASALGGLSAAPPSTWARIDFSDDKRFTGAATARGWAAKLGATWLAAPGLRLGASWHGKTALKDMTTSAQGASFSLQGMPAADVGRMTVRDFQMPQQLTVGAAWQATPQWLLAADVKQIGWSDVMQSFRMTYDSAGMGGSVDFALPQRWKDQTVVQVGAARRLGDWTLRGGLNLANNPVPADTVNPLFPAIVRDHATLGVGYGRTGAPEFNASLAYAPQVSMNTPTGLVISHRQINLQLMLSLRY